LPQTSRYTVMLNLDGGQYAFNAMSGGLAKVTSEQVHQLLCGQEPPDCTLAPAEQRDLERGWFLLPSGVDELLVLRHRRDLARFATGRMELIILPTLDCNFDCVYCYEQSKRPVYMDDAVAGALVTWVSRRLSEVRALGVCWYGGEPLCALDRIRELSPRLRELCSKQGLHYNATVVTNGYLLTPDVAEELHRLGVSVAQVSLDGPREVHDRRRPLKTGKGTFDRIVDNLVYASKLFPISLRMTIDKTNFDAVLELNGILTSRGVTGANLYFGKTMSTQGCVVRPEDCFSGAEMHERLCEMLARRQLGGVDPVTFFPRPVTGACIATQGRAFAVCPDGAIHKCLETVDKPEEAIGWVQEDELMIEKLLQWYTPDALTDDECRSCSVLPLCFGGCPYTWRKQGRPECIGAKTELPRMLEAQARYALWRKETAASQAGK